MIAITPAASPRPRGSPPAMTRSPTWRSSPSASSRSGSPPAGWTSSSA